MLSDVSLGHCVRLQWPIQDFRYGAPKSCEKIKVFGSVTASDPVAG